MRDEMFNSNLVCSFTMLLFLIAAQALIPAPRWEKLSHTKSKIMFYVDIVLNLLLM